MSDHELIEEKLTESVIGGFFEVYNALGFRYLEQVYNYLRSTRLQVGLLLHFGPEPAFYRLVHTHPDPPVSRRRGVIE